MSPIASGGGLLGNAPTAMTPTRCRSLFLPSDCMRGLCRMSAGAAAWVLSTALSGIPMLHTYRERFVLAQLADEALELLLVLTSAMTTTSWTTWLL